MTDNKKQFRTEHDSIGTREVPADAYYGVQTLRAYDNFRITGLSVDPEMIKSIAEIKKAAALVNNEVGRLDPRIADAICKACDEIIEGKLRDQFILDPIQGGAGTSFNMNANEVIANRAIELLGGEKGDYSIVHPNDHVNFGQSTNDVYPSSGRMAALSLLKDAKNEMLRLAQTLDDKSREFDNVIKMGRTQLQDAVPIRLGQEFSAWARTIRRDMRRFDLAERELRIINLGGTAIGTGINADRNYVYNIVEKAALISDLDLTQAKDLVDATQDLDACTMVSGIMKTCAVSLSKMCNDLRLMSSGPRCGLNEINLPAKQNGSSIMPGKINPVIPEVVNQVAFNIIGNDATIAIAVEAGQLELNAFEPVLFFNLFMSIRTLTGAVRTLTDNCISGITVNREHCEELVKNSIGIVTAFVPYLGYEQTAAVAKEALKTGFSVKELILKKKLMSEKEITEILDAYRMTEPGIGK
ncbi:MAG: aspartate ammonia-lyase [Eubacteriaceae bacterium]|jgi:aspartate ammonia-lyase|nr:aspartate ammonia-lyase [Eubacteriaceae bacterium]